MKKSLIIVCSLLLWGCTTPPPPIPAEQRFTTSQLRARDHAFPASATYRWYREMTPGREMTDAERWDYYIRAIAASLLKEKGYTHSKTAPDYVLDYYIVIRDAIKSDIINHRYGKTRTSIQWLDENEISRVYQCGTLIFDALSGDESQLLWRGSVSARIMPQMSKNERKQRVTKALESLLAQFPPK